MDSEPGGSWGKSEYAHISCQTQGDMVCRSSSYNAHQWGMPRFSRSPGDGMAAGLAAKMTTLRPKPSPREIFKKLNISTSRQHHV
jgi:hypothetical protein